MDPTTLVTFLFNAPAEARTVELLGSWDRFSQPYRMHNDRRRGAWSGVFKFENISFDGDETNGPRSGGLRQGARYWYYYRINSYDNTVDKGQPCTPSCPLLPGQVVNVLDVPIELIELPARCCTSSNIEGSLSNWQQLQTLDPARKYAVLDPPPVSKTHSRSLSDGVLRGRLENPPLVVVSRDSSVYDPSSTTITTTTTTTPLRAHSSLPNSEVTSSSEEEGTSPAIMSTALENPEESPTPGSDVVASPSFSVATAATSSDGDQSPLQLSPHNSIKRESRPASRNGNGAPLNGLANRFRSMRARQRSLTSSSSSSPSPPPRRQEANEPSTTLRTPPPPFLNNYALPTHAAGNNHSSAKTRPTPLAHGNLSLPTPFDHHPLLPSSYFPDAVDCSLADDIFSELGHLGASIIC